MNTIAYQFFSTVEIIQLSGAAIATAKNSHESLSASSAGKWTLLAPVGWANDPSLAYSAAFKDCDAVNRA